MFVTWFWIYVVLSLLLSLFWESLRIFHDRYLFVMLHFIYLFIYLHNSIFIGTYLLYKWIDPVLFVVNGYDFVYLCMFRVCFSVANYSSCVQIMHFLCGYFSLNLKLLLIWKIHQFCYSFKWLRVFHVACVSLSTPWTNKSRINIRIVLFCTQHVLMMLY